jgi:hypothetical protein
MAFWDWLKQKKDEPQSSYTATSVGDFGLVVVDRGLSEIKGQVAEWGRVTREQNYDTQASLKGISWKLGRIINLMEKDMSQKSNVKTSKKSVSSLPKGSGMSGPKSTPTPVTKSLGDKKVKSC